MLGRNVRVGRGEIDLHVRIDGEVTAVEVKTRADTGLDPVYGLDDAKLAQVRDLAASLRPAARRVDFIGVTVGRAGVDIHWLPRV